MHKRPIHQKVGELPGDRLHCFHQNVMNRETKCGVLWSSLVEAEMGKLMHQDEQELLSVWEGWHWDDNKGGWLDPELCAKARREEVEYIRRHKMYVRVPREVCLRETGKAPIKTGWAETDKGQPGKPNVRARWVANEYKTHARPELYASTPPLEALKVVLSEIATGEREGKVLALVDVRTAYFYAPARSKVFVELRPEDYSWVTNICVDCCDTACTAHVTPPKIGKRNLHRGSAVSG